MKTSAPGAAGNRTSTGSLDRTSHTYHFDLQKTRQPESRKQFTIIIVSYNVREFLHQALLSVRKAVAGLDAEIFVVDNASSDGTAEMVRSQFPECYVIENASNLGFARANNLALKRAHGRYVVLLNPDTIVQEDTFAVTQSFMETHPDTGMAGCKVLNPDGSLQLACRRSFPTPWVAFTKLTGLSKLFPKSRWFGKYNLTYLPEDEICEVEAISGSFMVIRREMMEQVGLLDEDFFLYGEDLDWCLRVRESGWKIHYYPTTQIVHFKGESSRASGLDLVRVFYQAMSLFVRKHFRSRLFMPLYWLLHVAIWLRAAIAVMRRLFASLSVPALDLFFMQVGLGLAIWLRFETSAVLPRYVIVDVVYSVVWLACLGMLGCFQRERFSTYKAMLAVLIGFFINASLTYFFKQYAFSRQVVLIAGLFNLVLLGGWRLTAKMFYNLGVWKIGGPWGRTLGLRTIIVGDFSSDEALVEKLKGQIDKSFDLLGLVSLAEEQVGQRFAGLPVIAALDNLDALLRSPVGQRLQQVIFSTQKVPFDRIIGAISRQRQQRIRFKLVPSHLDVIIGKASIDEIAEVPLVDIENRLLQFWPGFVKRAFDIVLATVVLIIAAPIFFVRWLMVHEFEEFPALLNAGRVVPLKVLKRSGRLGKWLWLFHVLAGKLTWVGKELSGSSEMPSHSDIGLRPGVTGLAQVNRKAELSREEKHKLDLYYVTHYSPLLDLEILFRAIFRI